MKSIKPSAEELYKFLPDFYEDVAYDGSPEFKDYIPKGVWLTLLEDELIAGFINLEPLNNVTWIAHVMIYPQYRRNNSEEWGKQAAKYMRDNLRAKKFLALSPYKAAKNYAERVGFKYLTIIKDSILKNGVLMDQYMLEME